MKGNNNLDHVVFLLNGSHRKAILDKLLTLKTPTEIKTELNLHFTQASRILIQLAKRGLARCINPTAKHKRFYIITPMGKTVLNKLKRMGR